MFHRRRRVSHADILATHRVVIDKRWHVHVSDGRDEVFLLWEDVVHVAGFDRTGVTVVRGLVACLGALGTQVITQWDVVFLLMVRVGKFENSTPNGIGISLVQQAQAFYSERMGPTDARSLTFFAYSNTFFQFLNRRPRRHCGKHKVSGALVLLPIQHETGRGSTRYSPTRISQFFPSVNFPFYILYST